MARSPRDPRDPQRTPLPLTDADLDALTSPEALSAPDVLVETRAWWRRHARPEDATLLDPEPADDAETDRR